MESKLFDKAIYIGVGREEALEQCLIKFLNSINK